MDYGAWEGRTYEQIRETDGAYREAWERDPDTLPCPGGESANDVAARVRGFLGDLLDEHRAWHAKTSFRAATSGWGAATARVERPVLAVAHATTNRILVCVALGIEVREFRRRLTQDQANVTVLQWDLEAAPDEGRMLVLNDTAHLRRADEAPWS
jgi:broad specificity phosphatase PhoE